MPHWSEGTISLKAFEVKISQLSQQLEIASDTPNVYFLQLPLGRYHDKRNISEKFALYLSKLCEQLHQDSVVCILCSPCDAALILPHVETVLKFHLWVAVKTKFTANQDEEEEVFKNYPPRSHSSLLVLTRYKNPLKHRKTRIKYTYCPACNKTTKDYGGKKHTYHEYGTLMSDVWRDIEYDPGQSTYPNPILARLCDIFGIEPYTRLYSLVFDCFSELFELKDKNAEQIKYQSGELAIQNPFYLKSELLNADCLEALSYLPNDSIDFCFADPPYNLKKQYDKWNDSLESIQYFEWCDRWLSELSRVLKPGCTLAVLNIPHWAVRHYQHLNSIEGMQFQSWIVWEALSFPVRMIMPAHYTILCFSKGQANPLSGLTRPSTNLLEKSYLQALEELYCLRASCINQRRKKAISDLKDISDLWYDIHRLKHNSRRVDHPCQLPPLLMRRLFALFTQAGDIILDCFNGAGTSTLVAQQMQRRFIGIELSKQYHAIALERHQLLEAGIDPFGKDSTTPKAKNSPVQRLPKQKYKVSKKSLQLEVKRIAAEIKRLPTRQEVAELSQFPIEYFDQYFISWGEVCAAARTTGMTEVAQEDVQAAKQMSLFHQELN